MDTLAGLLIRPHRSRYRHKDLGPAFFSVQGCSVRRTDLTLTNARGLRLACSWFRPTAEGQLPCVVYCHGNSGCRLDCEGLLNPLLARGITVFAFDFSGSGLSEGEFVSLGHFEQQDINTVLCFLKRSGTGPIALWGRSMGAAAALLFASQSKAVTALVVDSPFASLHQVSEELVKSYRLLPTVLGLHLLQALRSHLHQLTGFDLLALSPLQAAPSCNCPVLFFHSRADKLINYSHSEALYTAYLHPDKTLMPLLGGHNSPRAPDVYLEGAEFLRRRLCLHCLPRELAETPRAKPPSFAAELRNRLKHVC